ncbi:smoothelin-like protein 2 [Tigriopus californicus]|uniref:smoothelin-like protein 2 n=1 Tax=Tigriopus californicus TaxID=6832 RepID=UPI0027D9F18A|nr:smoothelin-like protein 2 [Tigriopus californicus]
MIMNNSGNPRHAVARSNAPRNIKLRDMDEKAMHNLFLKNMAGLIEETKNPSPCLNPNSKRGGMATHAGVALELGITRPSGTGKKMMSPQMEAILIWCQCRVRQYPDIKIENFTSCWADGRSFCALIHHFFPQAFDFTRVDSSNPKANYELAFKTGERYAGIPDFLTADDMDAMVRDRRIDPKMVFSYVQEVYRMCNEM